MKAIVVLRRGQRLTANQNRTLSSQYSDIREISTNRAGPMTSHEGGNLAEVIARKLEHDRETSVVFTAEEPFLLRTLSFWAGSCAAQDTHAGNRVKFLWTGDTGDSGWQIV